MGELKDLACVGFSADLTMQSFCHTAAYPKPVDVTTHRTLPKFISERGGVALRPGDGIIHSWLNRMLLPKIGKKNIFNGRVLEIGGLPDLKCEQAFELSDASAERSAAGCTIKLNKEPVIEYLTSNITLLKWMIAEGYSDERTLRRRISKMEDWLKKPVLMEADKEAEYCEVIEIDMNKITEPILCCPNDPDDAKLLSEVQGQKIDEVFIGSCMTNIGHYRAAGKMLSKFEGQLPTRLWIAPPTKMDQEQLTK